MKSSSSTLGQRLSAVATGILVVCAVTMTALNLRAYGVRRDAPPLPSGKKPVASPLPEWKNYAVGGQRMGSDSSSLLLVEFSDFQCPACRTLSTTLRRAREKHPELAILYRHMPLPGHKYAFQAAMASECAALQGRFEAMHDALFAHPALIGRRPWETFLDSAGVADRPAFDRCMKDSVAVAAKVQRDLDAGRQLKITGTPTFLIDGARINGSLPQRDIDSIVGAAAKAHRSGR